MHHSEAEAGSRIGISQLGTDPTGAVVAVGTSTTPARFPPFVSFDVEVPYDDDYLLWARTMGLDWNHNSFTVFVDSTEVRQFDNVRPVNNQWTWGWQPVAEEVGGVPVAQVFPLAAGTHHPLPRPGAFGPAGCRPAGQSPELSAHRVFAVRHNPHGDAERNADEDADQIPTLTPTPTKPQNALQRRRGL